MPNNDQPWIGRRLRSYEITSLLGVGGMGEVYRARDTKLQRDVAVKVLPESFANDSQRVSRFEQEARTLASLNHPHIGAIYGIEETDDQQYALVLELIEGATIGDRLASGRAIPLPEALRIARQIAEALEAAHEKGIVHRDLKPANIKITPAGSAKILDFGLAKAFSDDEQTSLSQMPTGTQAGTIMGTPGYMSPEQARGQAVNKQSDIWAFGCVFFEMLTGRVAFDGDTVSDTISAILEREPQWNTLPESTPAKIRELLNRCLEKDTRHRLHDIADARIEIENANLKTPAATKRSARPAIALSALVLLAVMAYLLWSKRNVIPVAEASVVALPAQVLGAQDLSFLTDAIPNTLSTQLGQVEGLETKVPPTSLEFETIHHDLGKIADLYAVKTCIVSSITATDSNHFVLNVQLVEPRSGQILWAQQYEGERGSYLDLARQAASGVREKLKPAGSAALMGAGPTQSSEAELAFREGVYFSNRYNNLHQRENFDKSMAAFQRALAADPKLANAPAEVAFLYRFRWEDPPAAPLTAEEIKAKTQQAITDIEQWANHALLLDPRCSKAWSAIVWSEYLRSPVDPKKLLEPALKAVTFGPKDGIAHTSLGATLQIISSELSLPAFLESGRADPLYVYSYFNAGGSLIAQGRFTEAIAISEQGIRIEPEFGPVLQSKYLSLLLLGRNSDAATFLGQNPRVLRDPGTQFISGIEGGDKEKVQQMLPGMTGAFKDPQVPGNIRIYGSVRMIPYLIEHGHRDVAMQMLTGMTGVGDVPSYSWLMRNPVFDSLRSDPAFQKVVASSHQQFDDVLKILEEKRAHGELPSYLVAPLEDLVKRLGRS